MIPEEGTVPHTGGIIIISSSVISIILIISSIIASIYRRGGSARLRVAGQQSINQSKILTEPHTGKEKPIPALPQEAANPASAEHDVIPEKGTVPGIEGHNTNYSISIDIISIIISI